MKRFLYLRRDFIILHFTRLFSSVRDLGYYKIVRPEKRISTKPWSTFEKHSLFRLFVPLLTPEGMIMFEDDLFSLIGFLIMLPGSRRGPASRGPRSSWVWRVLRRYTPAVRSSCTARRCRTPRTGPSSCGSTRSTGPLHDDTNIKFAQSFKKYYNTTLLK